MSALMLSVECGDGIAFHPILGTLVAVPDHDACPGGETRPGVIGGWTCSCQCHRVAPALEGSSTSETALTGPSTAANAGYRKDGGCHDE